MKILLSHRLWNKLPLALFLVAVAADAVGRVIGNPAVHRIGFLALGTGIVLAVVAAAFGIRDWVKLPEGDGKKKLIAFSHGWLMASTVATFGVVWILRFNRPGEPSLGASVLLYGACVLLLIGAYQGYRVVSKKRVMPWRARPGATETRV